VNPATPCGSLFTTLNSITALRVEWKISHHASSIEHLSISPVNKHPTMHRRHFLLTSGGLVASGLFTHFGFAQAAGGPPQPAPKPPALSADQTQAIVSAAHRSLDEVKRLVEETPLLVNASWDWGGGDFETPLQAAAHIGRPEIAAFLLERQARPDLHAAAMLGQLDVIKAAFAADPKAHEIPGPHGFTFLHCARAGGTKGKPVFDWLIAQGVPEVFQRPLRYVWPAGTGPGAAK
jgi:hypothetical protein